MAGNWDAEVKLLYPANQGTFFALNSVANGTAFDVIANLEVGKDLMGVITGGELFVSVRNLSQSANLVPRIDQKVALNPQPNELQSEERVTVAGWNASPGDVLEVVCAFKASAGIHTDYSSATSSTLIVD